MDSSSPSISAQEKYQLQQFVQQQEQAVMLHEIVSKITRVCWDKCISSTPGSKFSSSESACLANCARRFMDVSMIVKTRLENSSP
ncbi:hypothetical protein AQUCO_01100053v1 [Aquilegia coerulea]|uniref:Mitochondrial import inner membrane translocase subunit n=1 Tax=Aquilegia coerulea TaxID=218851 RepID=A0A2G5E5F2_AQUCA|nr:hypothetical protein AQUCO_01100053v1 [Aquilegia coerulea]